MATTPGLTLELWTDCAVKYIPFTPQEEDEGALVQAALTYQGPKLNVEIATAILMEAGQPSDRPFLPTLWTQDAIKARAEEEAARRPPAAPVAVADEEEDVEEVEDDE